MKSKTVNNLIFWVLVVFFFVPIPLRLNAQRIIKRVKNYILIDTDIGLGEVGNKMEIKRKDNMNTIVIGIARIVKFVDGKTAAEILNEKKGFVISVGDFVGNQETVDKIVTKNTGKLKTEKPGELSTERRPQGESPVLLKNDVLIVRTEGTSFLGSGITEDYAKTLAINDAKRTALEQAGTYLESHTEILNYTLVKDEIITYTAGLLKVTLLNEKRMLVNGMFTFKVEIEATIDIKFLDKRIAEIRSDRDLRKQLEAERERNKRLEARIAELQSSSSTVTKSDVKEIVNALSASDWFYKGVATDDFHLQVVYYNRAIELDPKAAYAYSGRGFAYQGLGRYNEAIQDFTRAIELDPKDANAHNNRGLAYDRLGRYYEAIRDYTRAIELDLKLANTYSGRGFAYQGLGRYNEAIRDYTRAIELDPKDTFAYDYRGLTYDELGRYNEAIQDFIKAIELDPKLTLAYSGRGIVYYKLGRYNEAILDFTRAIELDPKLANAYSGRGVAYLGLGRYNEAIRDYTRAIELDPKDAFAYYGRGLAYEQTKQIRNAVDDYNKYLELRGNKDGLADQARQSIRKYGYTPKY